MKVKFSKKSPRLKLPATTLSKEKISLVFDEFPKIFFNGINNLITTARSNKVATCLGM
jgi:hypothetical protein